MADHDATSARLVKAYRRMLERAREFTDEKHRLTLQEAIENAREKAVEFGELTRDEAHDIGEYVWRDLHDAGDYLRRTGRELREWAQIDFAMVEQGLLDLFSRVADRTRMEMDAFNREMQAGPPYRTGEMTGPGTLCCDACGQLMHFHQPGHIPPCPKCQHTTFRRYTDEADT